MHPLKLVLSQSVAMTKCKSTTKIQSETQCQKDNELSPEGMTKA